jgi:hypothetical protein
MEKAVNKERVKNKFLEFPFCKKPQTAINGSLRIPTEWEIYPVQSMVENHSNCQNAILFLPLA